MKGRIVRPEPGIDRVELPRVGFIKVGKKSEKGFPQSLDYFIASGKYAGLFQKAYGEKPNTIQIVFPVDDREKVCNEMYEYRDDEGRRVAYGDGETFFVWNGQKYAQYSTKDYPALMEGVAKKHPNKKVRNGGDGWDITLTLTFIIPLVRGVAGVWQFITKGSESTIPNITRSFDAMLEKNGFVKGVIFDLNVDYFYSQKPGDNSRYPVVTMVANESSENVLKVKEALKPIKSLESKE